MKNHPKECSLPLAIYRELYDVELLTKEMKPDTILAKRQELSIPLFARLKEAITQMRKKCVALSKSKLGVAIGHIENKWDTLTTYLNDANCPIDNNLAEQLMKHTATGRKNWLFLGSI